MKGLFAMRRVMYKMKHRLCRYDAHLWCMKHWLANMKPLRYEECSSLLCKRVRVSGGHLCIYAEAPTEPTGETGDRLRWRDSTSIYKPLHTNGVFHFSFDICFAYDITSFRFIASQFDIRLRRDKIKKEGFHMLT